MKTIRFKTNAEFDAWVAEGNELYCIYDKDGNELCDVEEPFFKLLLNSNTIDGDTREIKLPFSKWELEWLKETFGTKVIIDEEKKERRPKVLVVAIIL